MSKPKRWVFCTDLHGDMQDVPTVRTFHKFCDIWKPEIKVFGGDCFDFRALRSKASEGERYESGLRDFQAGLDFIRKYKPTAFLYGNHDQRLVNLLTSPNGNVRDQAQSMIDEIEHACGSATIIPYDKRLVYKIGDLSCVHGFGSGEGTVRKSATIYEKVIIGHLHRAEVVNMPGLRRREGYACPSMCKLAMPYNSTHLAALAHENGWAYGEVLPSGHTTVHLARRVGGIWHLPTEFRSIV